ncbi:HEAT repeat domain-containing protein [Leptospira idonii]|uniref:HEAT repeat domain-containing protein n=1 Tax=Leptospira idonii TaxID=1193500 RepID=A0A4R9M430_9LEPT|nr:HEAT repeat domain-containing protein [Leptospira idonii]
MFPQGNKDVSEEQSAFFREQRRRLDSADTNEIRDAIDRLTYVSNSSGVRDIISALKGNPTFPSYSGNSPVIKFYAAKALGKKKEKIAIEPLLSEFKKNAEPLVEREIKPRSLKDGVNGNESLSSPYFFLEDDISMVLACGEMLRALGNIPLNENSEKEIKQSLSHKNFYIRASAADAIYQSGKKGLISGLSESYGKEKDPYAKISILSALVGLEREPNQNFKSVLESLQDSDPEIRKKASEALVRLDLRIASPYLEKAISLENHPGVLAQMKEDYKQLESFRVP